MSAPRMPGFALFWSASTVPAVGSYVTTVAAVVLVFGLLSLFGDAAAQSLLPRLVPTAGMARANTALQQSDAVAQGGGPLLGGGLAGLVGAPLTIAVDAVGHVVAALLVWRTPLTDPRPPRAPRHAVLTELREGLSWVYRYPTLRPLAVSTQSGSWRTLPSAPWRWPTASTCSTSGRSASA